MSKTKKKFVTGASAKLGTRRTAGCGDVVGRQLLSCRTVKDMVALAVRLGADQKAVRPYLRSSLHLGIVRMAIGNRLRAVARHKEGKKIEKKKSARRQPVEVS